jgi:hypothetical protein
VASVSVILDWSEHMCCGEHREFGDTVTIEVQNYDGTVYKERHGERGGIETDLITGVITSIRWRPQIILREGDFARKVIGYEPGFPIDSTDYDDPEETEWAFEFTVDTDDQVPSPRSAL